MDENAEIAFRKRGQFMLIIESQKRFEREA